MHEPGHERRWHGRTPDRLCRLCVVSAVLGLAAGAAGVPAAPLTAQELLLLYNADDRDSSELAAYYARVRGVPAGQSLGLKLTRQAEEVPAEEYDQAIREPVRAFLEKNGLRQRVRCLVTFYGLPTRVRAQTLPPARAPLLAQWREELQQSLDAFQDAIGELKPAATRPARREPVPPTPEARLQQLQRDYLKARQEFFDRLKREQAAEAGEQMQKLVSVMYQVEGAAGVVNQVGMQSSDPRVSPEQLKAQLRQGVQEKQARIQELLDKGIDHPDRVEARRLMREVAGLAGVISSLQTDITFARPDETEAAVDSELALLWWDSYPKHRWIRNFDNWRVRAEAAGGAGLPQHAPILMVGRIDGPSRSIAQGLIDKAIAAERELPAGVVYVDARGLRGNKGHAEYDAYLRRLAGMVRATKLRAKLDNRPALFQPGKCPDTLLYCGWYSLRKYVDAFDFVPGAVGYHIASFEAISLRQPGEQGWCARMLSDGVTATLGPVAEPYLQAFPRPDDFFGLLLTGRLTLAEVYASTVPYHSWMMMLIGDPLYRPFAARPALKLEEAVRVEVIPDEYRQAATPAAR